MPHIYGADFVASSSVTIACQFRKLHPCQKLVKGHGKDYRAHLLPQHNFEAPFERRRPKEPKVVSRLEGWSEKREPLYVIPVRVTEEHVSGYRRAVCPRNQAAAKLTNACARVKNDELVVVSSYLDAGGVTAKSRGRRSRCWTRATRTPETNAHEQR